MSRVVDVTVAAPVHVVWRALRDPELVRRWHGWQEEGLDAEVEEIYGRNAVEDADAQELVVSGGDRFSVRPSDSGTLVRVTRAPLGSDPFADRYDEDLTEGWWTFLQQLRFGLECHDLAPRQTVQRQGRLDGDVELLDAFVGELDGQVMARSASQVAVVGDGGATLAILARQPTTQDRPLGGFLLVGSGYDMAPAAFAAVAARWQGWWQSHQPSEEPPRKQE